MLCKRIIMFTSSFSPRVKRRRSLFIDGSSLPHLRKGQFTKNILSHSPWHCRARKGVCFYFLFSFSSRTPLPVASSFFVPCSSELLANDTRACTLQQAGKYSSKCVYIPIYIGLRAHVHTMAYPLFLGIFCFLSLYGRSSAYYSLEKCVKISGCAGQRKSMGWTGVKSRWVSCAVGTF